LERDPVWCGEVFLQVGTAVSVLREKEREEGGRGRGMEGGGAHCGGKAQLSSEYNPQQTHRTHRKAQRRVASHHVCVETEVKESKKKRKHKASKGGTKTKLWFGLCVREVYGDMRD